MALKVVLSHKTSYKFDKKINLSPHIIRLRPAPHSRTPIESYSLKIKPDNHFLNWQQDPYGNYQARVMFPEKTNIFSIDVEILADMITINPFDFFIEKGYEEFPFKYKKELKKELKPFLKVEDKSQEIKEFIKTIDKKKMQTNDFLVYLNQKIYNYLEYTIRLEPGVQSCSITLGNKLGSCRDYAWLFVQVFRQLGLAARFVSGYLVQLKSDEKSLDGPSGPEEDFTDLHAWTEVYIPGAGWIGLDSTSGLFAGEGHIPLACTPSPDSAHAVEGFMDPAEVEFDYSNTVQRVFESPRVTKPYTKQQWEDIYQLGFEVDKDLEANDVRLSMGGEPTFVSIDDMESDQWNTGADGEHKRELAHNLTHRLYDKFAKGGLLHYAQGKWYPGEELPRWNYSMFWRKDGNPIWRDKSYLADIQTDYKYTTKDAKRFIDKLSLALGVSEDNVITAYEDPIYYILQEANLPVDLDILNTDLKDDSIRKSLALKLSKGLNKAVGYVLPLNHDSKRWVSSKWKFRRGELFLNSGDSPIGLRLPLGSLEINPPTELEESFEIDLFGDVDKLLDFHEVVQKRVKKISKKISKTNSSSMLVRTALNIEARDGRVYIFMPPILQIEPYLDLVASIESCAKELDIKVVLEGYEPPADLRIDVLKVTPDPGVIEVNLQPASSWEKLSYNILELYKEAKLSRLATEKFKLDGVHTGTGGGNHVTIGAMSPSDSPLLRRPDLLRSLITFWQHHPALSYLFSGAFIGPTSQAPRVDEGRVENLYELEIAFEQIPKGEEVPFWLTDRLFRHLLTDITGNTHRSEFCIDKLYSPDSSTGRLGILELRGFDMPPHSQMALLQMLLVRALVSAFWKKPYKHKLVRWGTTLHDKFLLEHYVKEDIKDVVEFLNDAGYEFRLDWFNPFFEFRFPLYGLSRVENMQFELRSAIEPWHVLGEESSSSGTARYVDSSLERVQIKVNDFNPSRYTVSVNGVEIPLVPTSIEGEYVAGVRYKAWEPYSALHPTIGVDTPLTFDVIDKWNSKSVGGFNYYVSHPGGRTYDTFPVNSYEAHSRRDNRFENFGHSQGEVVYGSEIELKNNIDKLPKVKRELIQNDKIKKLYFQEMPKNREYPHTLDLRKRWNV